MWYDLWRTALGEIAYTTEGMDEEAQARLAAVGVGDEEMYEPVRPPQMSAVIGKPVQASFGIDIRRLPRPTPDLLLGHELIPSSKGLLEMDPGVRGCLAGRRHGLSAADLTVLGAALRTSGSRAVPLPWLGRVGGSPSRCQRP